MLELFIFIILKFLAGVHLKGTAALSGGGTPGD
jgi:hypothetical protein